MARANAFNQGWVRELPSFRGGSSGNMFMSQKSDWPNASFMKVLMALTVQLDQTGLDCYGANTTGKGGRIVSATVKTRRYGVLDLHVRHWAT